MSNALILADPGDIYLAPHSDDVCFSLGLTVWRRRMGTLLTVFPRSGYLPRRAYARGEEGRAVTRLRIAEDSKFADACGVRTAYLDFGGASESGWQPFDLRHVPDNADRIERALMRSLMGPAIGRAPRLRPWLFCPVGIGGHVNHVAIRMVIVRNVDQLSRSYRLAFYEDLHYAADASKRLAGIDAFARSIEGLSLNRYWWPLGDQQDLKMSLIRLYASQLTGELDAISAFTPALKEIPVPHEAVWARRDNVNPVAA